MDASQTFRERLPHRPYCSDNLDHGLIIRSSDNALRHRFLQPNPPLQVAWLVFDLDYPGAAFAWEQANLPPPTIAVVNPANRHAHLYYGLVAPVSLSEASRQAPIRFASAIQSAFAAKLKADLGYGGLIAKNPFHPDWTSIWVHHLYELSELAEYVNLTKKLPRQESAGLGRNCTLFDQLRCWAYQWIRQWKSAGATSSEWFRAVLSKAEGLNVFTVTLPSSEVRATAKSVAKWTWQNITEEKFSEIQSARGRRGGRPKTTTKHGNPWDEDGVSRATYYRKRRNLVSCGK